MHLFGDRLAQRAYEATFVRYPDSLLPALRALAGTGDGPMHWHESEDEFLRRIRADYSGIVAMVRRLQSLHGDTWSPRTFLHDVLSIAQTDFAVMDCRADRREDSLTGSLMTRLWTAAAMLNVRDQAKHSRPTGYVCLIELIGHGFEQDTGGDVALVHDNTDWQFAFCFQAKRTKHPLRDEWIGKGWRPEPGEHVSMPQLEKLRELEAKCPGIRAAYLMYDQAVSREAFLPLAKPIDALEDHIYSSGHTNLAVGTSDLASFVASTLHDVAQHGGATASFNEMMVALAEAKLKYLVSSSPDRSFGRRLATGLKHAANAAGAPAIDFQVAEAALQPPLPGKLASMPNWVPKPDPWRPSSALAIAPPRR